MKKHTDYNKHTDMTQGDKIFRMSRNEAEEACLNGAMSKHTDGKTEWWCCHA